MSRGNQNIEATKGGIDEESKFSVETGSLFLIKEFESIESISWGSFAHPAKLNPTTIGTLSKSNDGSRDLVKSSHLKKINRN